MIACLEANNSWKQREGTIINATSKKQETDLSMRYVVLKII